MRLRPDTIGPGETMRPTRRFRKDVTGTKGWHCPSARTVATARDECPDDALAGCNAVYPHGVALASVAPPAQAMLPEILGRGTSLPVVTVELSLSFRLGARADAGSLRS